MKSNILILFCCFLFLASCQAPSIEEYTLLPHPVDIKYIPGMVKLKTQPTLVYPGELANEALLLQCYLSSDFSVQATLKKNKKKGDIILQLDPAVLPEQAEGYILDATSGNIVLKANSPAGILNAIQTFRQVLKVKDGRLIVQKSTLTDYPVFSWRAFMLDEGRYFKGKEVVFDLLDEMAALKMNVFHWHLTDDQGWRIEIKKYPKLTEIGAWRDSSEIDHFGSNRYDGRRHGGFYTQEEIKEVVDYAAKRNITVIPEIEMPGHASAAIAAYPWLGTSGKQIKVPGKFGVQYDIFNVADPRVIHFLNDVMDEVISLFPAPIFHVGGDEVR